MFLFHFQLKCMLSFRISFEYTYIPPFSFVQLYLSVCMCSCSCFAFGLLIFHGTSSYIVNIAFLKYMFTFWIINVCSAACMYNVQICSKMCVALILESNAIKWMWNKNEMPKRKFHLNKCRANHFIYLFIHSIQHCVLMVGWLDGWWMVNNVVKI